MQVLYNAAIYLFDFTIRLAALVNPKARLWMNGRKGLLGKIEDVLRKDEEINERKKRIWFHCASLGEFEQGRPVIEKFRETLPGYTIILTFFSPSGFEVRKNYTGADQIFYLPLDTVSHARRFVEIVNPDLVIFIKYEYWINYLSELANRGIPIYVVSAIFRHNQHFFKWYGSWFRKKLRMITWFFVQNEESRELLQSSGISKVSVSGDTRFDRVSAITSQDKPFPLITKFCDGNSIMVAGSTWEADEEILIPWINDPSTKMKLIIAPHEIHPSRIESITRRLNKPYVRYSEAKEETIREKEILIIDSIGMLAFIYKYGTIAYVGGGFGVGIHNILEAAAYGVPVIFGPNYKRFGEARELVEKQGSFSIRNNNEFISVLNRLLDDPMVYKQSAKTNLQYVKTNLGATEKIMQHIHG
ncbi:MAG: 3-deoxy-D-manno-octulosonic acid transferase [Bacteroidetes bacterium]|nr:3-deoxy-D-manno-octulosonic acid transferase [Bacteroidota bacterium]